MIKYMQIEERADAIIKNFVNYAPEDQLKHALENPSELSTSIGMEEGMQLLAQRYEKVLWLLCGGRSDDDSADLLYELMQGGRRHTSETLPGYLSEFAKRLS